MDEYFGSFPVSNSTMLCVGGITGAEARRAQDDGLHVDGFGYYLFLASDAEPTRPIEILAKFPTLSAAEKLARLFLRAETAF
jgi:hypothetical protein